MPKKKRRDSPEKQSQRFVETARSFAADESGISFERALGAVMQPKKVSIHSLRKKK